MIKTCQTCRYLTVGSSELPCRDCSHMTDNSPERWEAPEHEAAINLAETPKAEKAEVELPLDVHYLSTHQPIETMQANMTPEEFRGFLKGNIIKYACRCGRKDEPEKEAQKILQYAMWHLAALRGETINPRN